jgi:hypothetical protein
MAILNWRTTASEMMLSAGNNNTYSIFRQGGSGYWTLGRTSSDTGVMTTIANNFAAVADAQAAAETDYEQSLTTATT